MNLAVVILAAGKGTRMKSALPKVLHPVAGKPMLEHVLQSARELQPGKICIVYGHEGDKVRQAVPSGDVLWVEQAEQLGTGHAVHQAIPSINEQLTLVLYGDVPLIQADTLQAFINKVSENRLALMTLTTANPDGYGRIVRDNGGKVQAIVEQKDASPEQLNINEVNTGIVAAPTAFLKKVLPALSANNAQGEYYLTDIIAMAVNSGLEIETVSPTYSWEVDGINDRVQQSRLERIYQRNQAERMMRNGVTLVDPARLDVRGHVEHAQDIFIDINCVLQGHVVLGQGVVIEPGCVLIDCVIGDNVTIKANSHLEGVKVEAGCDVGPFARLRPGAVLQAGAKVGNFVEIKKSEIGPGAKVNHLTYIGDAKIGKSVNVGAGTITCNYDGVNKFQTVIEEGAFIGSNTSLVAPVRIGRDATIGAGSTISKDVPAHELAVARGQQRNIRGWQRPKKKN